MNNRKIVLSFIAIVTTVAIVFSACRKINDSTELGGDLIPPVDNITTFDTLIDVQAYNDTFGFANDSQFLARSEEHFLGLINADPFFGKTDARLFLELKPTTYGVYPFARRDSVKIDSIVLVLDYVETYGDTNTAQTFQVYEMDQSNNFTQDSAYLIRKENFTYNTTAPLNIPGQTFIPRTFNDTVKAFRDTSVNQIRIKLDTNFARRLFNYDTSDAYKSDTNFRKKFKGFAIRSENTGNAIVGIDLGGFNTKLAIYYNYAKVSGTRTRDTTVNYFFFTTQSAAANYVKRDYTGTPLLASLNNGTTADPIIYIQNTPGTFANLKIPGLANIGNRVVHRAELVVEQLYDISDSTFPPPELMYLDAFDPAITTNYKYRTIPYDLLFASNSGALNLVPFGVIPLITTDGSGNKIRTWKFNISRYVQHVVNGTQTSYDLRLLSPFSLNEKYSGPAKPDPSNFSTTVFINSSIAKGRVRLIGNNGTGDTNPRRLRLRIVYSKL